MNRLVVKDPETDDESDGRVINMRVARRPTMSVISESSESDATIEDSDAELDDDGDPPSLGAAVPAASSASSHTESSWQTRSVTSEGALSSNEVELQSVNAEQPRLLVFDGAVFCHSPS